MREETTMRMQRRELDQVGFGEQHRQITIMAGSSDSLLLCSYVNSWAPRSDRWHQLYPFIHRAVGTAVDM